MTILPDQHPVFTGHRFLLALTELVIFLLSARKREERLKAVAKRREEQTKKEVDLRKGIEQKDKETKNMAARVHEEKLKEEKERQKLRQEQK